MLWPKWRRGIKCKIVGNPSGALNAESCWIERASALWLNPEAASIQRISSRFAQSPVAFADAKRTKRETHPAVRARRRARRRKTHPARGASGRRRRRRRRPARGRTAGSETPAGAGPRRTLQKFSGGFMIAKDSDFQRRGVLFGSSVSAPWKPLHLPPTTRAPSA